MSCSGPAYVQASSRESDYLKLENRCRKLFKTQLQLEQSVQTLQSDVEVATGRLKILEKGMDNINHRLKYLEKYHETKVRPVVDHFELEGEIEAKAKEEGI